MLDVRHPLPPPSSQRLAVVTQVSRSNQLMDSWSLLADMLADAVHCTVTTKHLQFCITFTVGMMIVSFQDKINYRSYV